MPLAVTLWQVLQSLLIATGVILQLSALSLAKCAGSCLASKITRSVSKDRAR